MTKVKTPLKRKSPPNKQIPRTDENFIVIPDNMGTCPDDKVLILQDEAMQKTSGGIIIPDTAKEVPHTGIVVAVGQRTDDKKVTVDQGDRVIFGKYSGVELNLLGTIYILMKQNEILWNFKQ